MQRVGAVIVTYNKASMLNALLTDLLKQTRRPDEILVIDNASSDSTESMIKNFSHFVRYIKLPENIGSAGGYHEGIRLACEKNDLVWTLDDDVTMDSGALEELLKGLSASELLAGNTGVVRSWTGDDLPPFSSPKEIDSFAWRGTLIKREIIEDVGLPLKEYFLYADDVEYSFRIAKAGYAIFWIPESRVIEKRKENKESLKMFGNETIVYSDAFRLYYAFRNQVHLYWKYKEFRKFLVTVIYAIKVMLLLLISNRSGDIFAVIKGVCDGLMSKLGKNLQYLPSVK